MKTHRLLLFLFIIVWGMISCTQKNNDVVITGRLTGVEDGTVITLSKSEGRMFTEVASDTLTDGIFNFTIQDTVPGSKAMMIRAKGEGFPPTWLEIRVEPGAKINITGTDKLLRTWEVESDVKDQQEQNRYLAETKDYIIQSQKAMREAYSYWDEINKSSERREDLYKKIEELYALNDSMTGLILKEELLLMEQNPTYSPFWMEKIQDHSLHVRYNNKYPDIERLKQIFDNLPEEYKNTETGKLTALNLYPPKVVQDGENLADADLYDLEGKLHHLADYKGKYLLLDFWSSGCGPCLSAIPEMREIAEIYKEKLHIIGICSDSKEQWEKISKEKNITWVNLNDFMNENGIFMSYGITGIPHYVMITPEGKKLTSWTGYGTGSLKSKMEEFVK